MIKTISHIILSALFFVLTVGLSINKHYSNGKLYSQSFFGEAESCDADADQVCTMQDMTKECEIHKKNEITNSEQDCSCEDTSEYIHFDADYVVPEKLQLNKVVSEHNIIMYQIASVLDNINTLFHKQTNYLDAGNSSPNVPDRLSLFQVFRC